MEPSVTYSQAKCIRQIQACTLPTMPQECGCLAVKAAVFCGLAAARLRERVLRFLGLGRGRRWAPGLPRKIRHCRIAQSEATKKASEGEPTEGRLLPLLFSPGGRRFFLRFLKIAISPIVLMDKNL